MTVALALLSAVAYGVSDFIGGVASRRASALRVLLLSYPLGVVGLLAAVPFVAGVATTGSLLWGAVSGIAGGGGVILLYAGLASGPMSVIAPLTAVCGAVVPVTVGVARGERLSVLAFVGVGLALAAVALVSREPRRGDDEPVVSLRGVALALLAGAGFGAYFVLLDLTGDGTGLWPLVVSRLVGSVVVVAAAFVAGQLAFPGRGTWLLPVVAGLLDVIANVGYLLAVRSGLLALVAVLVALYPAATVLLARLVLAERTSAVQRVGLGLAAVSVALITLA